jgi:AraC family transcriptional regulator, arabinose operon regulatory protein
MEGLAEYMDDVMTLPTPLRLYLGMWPVRRARGFEIHGLARNEPFRPKIVNRPGGTRDWLLMQFHSPVEVQVDGQMMDCSPGTLFLWEPRAAHHYGSTEGVWYHSWVHCDGAGIDAVFRASRIPLNRPVSVGNAGILGNALAELHAELVENRRPDRIILEDIVEILVRRLRRCMPGQASSIAPPILAARAYLEQNLLDPPTLKGLARIVGMSPSHLSSEFKKHIGLPPMRYLLEQRLRQAAYLLADQSSSVSGVAHAVGFQDPLYFSRQFKNRFGTSPTQHRRERTLLDRS